ncbi:hypothetical protein SAY86_015328 [Trapa natans]|uniref:Uncharacterized protein n=1 Tax=Trapa natans TaxID=22666 RepID=A0AAN7KEJ4_TRANT|nr:hypothetical protein SAY86_015328 [Trapa natans]
MVAITFPNRKSMTMVKEVVPGFKTGHATEAGLPVGPPAVVVDTGDDPVLGITEEVGDGEPADNRGDDAGANMESFFTVLGGAMRGGNN